MTTPFATDPLKHSYEQITRAEQSLVAAGVEISAALVVVRTLQDNLRPVILDTEGGK